MPLFFLLLSALFFAAEIFSAESMHYTREGIRPPLLEIPELTPVEQAKVEPTKGTKLLDVPLSHQHFDYSCGASALKSVLSYYGVNLHEAYIIAEAKTDPKTGTELTQMLEVAKKHGVKAEIRSNMTIENLKGEIAAGNPVIVDCQAWAGREVNYAKEWDEGHYMVAIGVDEKNVYFMDPSLFGSRGSVPVKEFMDRWHEITEKLEKGYQRGLVFRGTPKPPVSWVPVP